jgi:uncharacterized protein involved in exopolysaccharide biosynthesis
MNRDHAIAYIEPERNIATIFANLWAYKYRNLFVIFICMAVAGFYQYISSRYYESLATLEFVTLERQALGPGSGAFSSGLGSGGIGGTLQMLAGSGPSLELERVAARMKSRDFIESIIKSDKLDQLIFSEGFGVVTRFLGLAIDPSSSRAPQYIQRRASQILSIDVDKRTQFLKIRAASRRPEVALTVILAFIKNYNFQNRNQELNEINRQISLLEAEMQSTALYDTRLTLVALIARARDRRALISISDEYPLKYIETPIVAKEHYWPNAFITLGAGFGVGVMLVFIGCFFYASKLPVPKTAEEPVMAGSGGARR